MKIGDLAEIFGFCLTALGVAAIFANAWIKIKTTNPSIKNNCLERFKDIDQDILEVETMSKENANAAIKRSEAIVRLETEVKHIHTSISEMKEDIAKIFGKLDSIWKDMPKRHENGLARESRK